MGIRIRAETKEIVPRAYGIRINGVFERPSAAVLAYVLVTNPEKNEFGLVDMLKAWHARKQKELKGEYGYIPLFGMTKAQEKRIFGMGPDEFVKHVRERIRANHRSYNLWDCYGKEAVRNLELRGDLLTAEVKSQGEGWRAVNLKGAIRGMNGEIRYADPLCSCEDFRWAYAKGGTNVSMPTNCLHIKAAELESYLQANEIMPVGKELMKTKGGRRGEKSLSFSVVHDPFLKHLIADVLVAREVLGVSQYEIDRKLMAPPIAQAITPLSLQQQIAQGDAWFEIVKQENRIRKIDSGLLETQRIVQDALWSEMKKHGYEWKGYCLEFGIPAYRYENDNHSVSLVLNPFRRGNITNELPFYVVRSLKDAEPADSVLASEKHEDPFRILLANQRKFGNIFTLYNLDDKCRRITPAYVEPGIRINLPESDKSRDLRFDLPRGIIADYREQIEERTERPGMTLRALRISF